MAQVSYGTITITDTTDIERIYMVYAGSESNITPPDVNDFALWKTDVTQTSGTYIWQRAVVKKSGIEITAQNFQQFYGEPACITGEGGRSIKSITTYYCNYGIGTPDEDYSEWSINTPEYDSSKPNYWVKTVIIYVDDSEENFELSGDIVTFEDGEHKYLTSLITTLDPIQDLNGYDAPWVGGAGKNKLAPWFSTQTKYGVTWTVNADGTFTSSGTASQNSSQIVTSNIVLPDGTYIISGCPTGGSGSTYYLRALLYDSNNTLIDQWSDFGSGKTFTIDSATTAYIKVFVSVNNGQTAPSGTWKPMIRLASETDATYAPYENICPISGHDEVDAHVTGFNVWDEEWETGGINATTGANSDGFTSRIRSKNYISVIPNTQYYFLLGSTLATSRTIYYYDANKAFISGGWVAPSGNLITIPNNSYYIRFTSNDAYGGTYNNDISINYPSTDHDYHAYVGQSYNTPLGQTVYGGTLDVISGILTDEITTNTFDNTVNVYSVSERTNTVRAFIAASQFNPSMKPNGTNVVHIWCDKLAIYAPDYVYSNDIMGISENKNATQAGVWISIEKSLLSAYTAAGVQTWLGNNPITVAYLKATPQTYQLTPQTINTLVGVNNVWSDAGEVTVSGFTIVDKDIQIYLDNALTDAIAQSVEANTNASEALNKANEAESIATHANEDSQGAMSQAAATKYATEALAAKVKHYWWDLTGAHIASGINGADVTEGTASTYGFNSLVGLASITFGYNSYKAVELDGSIPALKFYKPSKTAQGDLAATLNSNGLVLSKGGIEAGTKNTTDYIYVYSHDDATNHTLIINNSEDKSDWRIIAGNKFGVDKAGNLYASNAHVEGAITATSLTIGSGSSAYDGAVAINGIINDLNTKANSLDLNNTTIDARSALAQFSDVKDVLGVLGWISEHGSYSLTTDTEVDKNKAYYSYNNVSGTYTQVSVPSSTVIKDMYELIVNISYIKTKDVEIEPNKEYYTYDGTNFVLVQNPIVDDIDLYYEKVTTSRYEKTNDSSPVSGKTYYKYDIETNQYIAATPTQTIGQYYELSIEESIKDYLLTHLSVSNGALSVKNDDNSYYMVLEGSGALIKNSLGQTVASYGNEIILGEAANGIRNVITSTRMSFRTDAGDIAYFGLNDDGIWQMHIATTFVDDMIRFGDYAWIKRNNGNMSIKWLGV